MADVVVVGSLNVDLVVRAPRHPRPGETLTGDGFATDNGGKGANQAVAAARGGASVAMIGCVGDDDHGRRLRAALARERIADAAVGTDPRLPTGVALIVVAHDGENTIVVVPGANHAPTPAQVDAAAPVLAAARIVVAQLEVLQPTVAHAFLIARRNGTTTLLNAAPAAELLPVIWSALDWLVVNESEAARLLGESVADIADPAQARAAAQALRARGAGNVVVTLGAHGLVHASADGVSHHPATPVQAVDSTGAGDTFVGVLAAGLAKGLPAADALRRGQAAAAIAVTRRGAQSAMPSLAEIEAALRAPSRS